MQDLGSISPEDIGKLDLHYLKDKANCKQTDKKMLFPYDCPVHL